MKKTYFFTCIFLILFVLSGFSQNPRNLLIDDVTATGCSHCACMDSVLHYIVLEQHPNTTVLGIQGQSSMFYQPSLDSLIMMLGFQSTSTLVNREGSEQTVDGIVDSVNARYAAASQSPVKISITAKTYNPDTRMVNITVEITSLDMNLQGIFRINLAVTENNVMGPQQHDPGCPGGDPYPDKFIPHYNVMRKIVLPVQGETLINGAWAKDQTFTKTYSFKLDSIDWDATNCNIVVYVDKKGVSLGTSQIQQSIIQSVTRPVGVGPDPDKFGSVIAIYPNPSMGESMVKINIKESGIVRLYLVNSIGQEVAVISDQLMGVGNHSIRLNTAGLSSGLYSLILQMQHERNIYKLIIQ